MKMWIVRAKEGRTVYLPMHGDVMNTVPTTHDGLFPDSPALAINRDRPEEWNDLEKCELVPDESYDHVPAAEARAARAPDVPAEPTPAEVEATAEEKPSRFGR
jgi:hypothetical protein